MKNCEAYEALLDAFAEGDLFTEDMLQVQQHLNHCPHCQAYIDDLLAIRAAFPSAEDEIVPEGFVDTVMAAVAAHPRTAPPPVFTVKKKSGRWTRFAAPVAACCAIVLVLQNGPFGAHKSASQEAAAAPTVAYSLETADMAAPAAAKAEEAVVHSKTSAANTPAESGAGVVMEPQAEAKVVTEDSLSHATDIVTEAFSPHRIRVTVDADYIGSTLDDYTPVAYAELPEGGSEIHYELTTAQYEALLQMLADRDELPAEEEFETPSDLVLVVVRK